MSLRYILYARKSSESEDRQVQSLDDQVRIMSEVADRFGLSVLETLTESQSAKEPGIRPVFDAMLRTFEERGADGILCWNVNRLSRNPVDGGALQWLLQQERIKEIRTVDRVFLPSDNALLFAIESGQANQYIRELSQNVKRGMNSRAEKGWCCHKAPEGYLNDSETRTIAVDPERMPVIERLFREVLAGEHSVPELLRKLNDEWGYRTKPTKKTPSGRLSRSGVYTILKNPFYAGYFSHGGDLHEGRHRPVITWAEHERVLEALGLKQPAPRTNEFAYSLTAHCGGCGRYVCGLRKRKLVKSAGVEREYVYYYCANSQCPNRSKNSITEKELERQIEDRLRKVAVLPEFVALAEEGIARAEAEERAAIERAAHQRELAAVEAKRRLDELLDMRLAGLVDDEEYRAKKERLSAEIHRVRRDRDGTRAGDWDSPWTAVAETVRFAATAPAEYRTADARTKRQIARKLGAEYVLWQGKLTIVTSRLLRPIEEGYPALEREFLRLEPTKRASCSTEQGALTELLSSWSPILFAIRTEEMLMRWEKDLVVITPEEHRFARETLRNWERRLRARAKKKRDG